jgi:hypothetical protein
MLCPKLIPEHTKSNFIPKEFNPKQTQSAGVPSIE